MPDWKYFRDREGYTYYYDRAFKIRITERKPFNHIPVTPRSIEYHYKMAEKLVKEHDPSGALYILKSIMALGRSNNRIRTFQVKSNSLIHKLQSQHGDRFSRYNRENAILIINEDGGFKVINDLLKYSLMFSNKPEVIKKKWKYMSKGHSVKIGIGRHEGGGYDYLLGIESRIYRSRLLDINRAVNSWTYEVGMDDLKRTEIDRGDSSLINEFSFHRHAPFSGIEAYFIKNNRFFYIRTMCHNSMKSRVLNEMKRVVRSFKPLE